MICCRGQMYDVTAQGLKAVTSEISKIGTPTRTLEQEIKKSTPCFYAQLLPVPSSRQAYIEATHSVDKAGEKDCMIWPVV